MPIKHITGVLQWILGQTSRINCYFWRLLGCYLKQIFQNCSLNISRSYTTDKWLFYFCLDTREEFPRSHLHSRKCEMKVFFDSWCQVRYFKWRSDISAHIVLSLGIIVVQYAETEQSFSLACQKCWRFSLDMKLKAQTAKKRQKICSRITSAAKLSAAGDFIKWLSEHFQVCARHHDYLMLRPKPKKKKIETQFFNHFNVQFQTGMDTASQTGHSWICLTSEVPRHFSYLILLSHWCFTSLSHPSSPLFSILTPSHPSPPPPGGQWEVLTFFTDTDGL